MSVEIASDTDSLGQFATNKGYSDLVDAVQAGAGKFPFLTQLVTEGASQNAAGCAEELSSLFKNKTVGSVAKELASLIADQQGMIMVTDGLFNENTDDSPPDGSPNNPVHVRIIDDVTKQSAGEAQQTTTEEEPEGAKRSLLQPNGLVHR